MIYSNNNIMTIHRNDCRGCRSTDVIKFLDLGLMPKAGSFLTEEQVSTEPKYQLDVYVCRRCSLVQILDIIPQEVLFTNYQYLSSITRTLREHFSEYAKEIHKRFLGKDSLVVEIGSNDGVLLQPFNALGISAIGVEPATNVAEIAKKKGLSVINKFFNREVAMEIRSNYGRAKVICANNVFAHIDDLDEVLLGLRDLLEDNGVFVFEVHYLLDLLEKYQYDTIYHEHLCYYSLTALSHLLERFGMVIFDVKRISTHSGSIRVYAKTKFNNSYPVHEIVRRMIEEEKEVVYDLNKYFIFAESLKQKRWQLCELLWAIKKVGKKIVGYGAAGRGTILINYCNIGKDLLDYVVDESPTRRGFLMPGKHIPIVGPERIKVDMPDYILLLAWSYENEVVSKEKAFVNKGGKFIIPLPDVRLLPQP